MLGADLGAILITCGHCDGMTSQEVVAGYENVVEEILHNDRRRMVVELHPVYRLSRCPACGRFNLSVAEDEDPMSTIEVLWPVAPKRLSGLPSNVDTAYKAALSVKNIDSNAFGVLTRRLLEMVCIDRGAQGHSLIQQLRDLSTRGDIPGRLADMAQQLRQLGNLGAHAGSDLTVAEVPLLDDLCRAILEYVYVAPQTIARVQERINALKGAQPSGEVGHTLSSGTEGKG